MPYHVLDLPDCHPLFLSSLIRYAVSKGILIKHSNAKTNVPPVLSPHIYYLVRVRCKELCGIARFVWGSRSAVVIAINLSANVCDSMSVSPTSVLTPKSDSSTFDPVFDSSIMISRVDVTMMLPQR